MPFSSWWLIFGKYFKLQSAPPSCGKGWIHFKCMAVYGVWRLSSSQTCLTRRSVQQNAKQKAIWRQMAEQSWASFLSACRHAATVWDGVEWMQKQSLPNTVITLLSPLPHSSLTLNSASTYFLNPLSVLLYSSSTHRGCGEKQFLIRTLVGALKP